MCVCVYVAVGYVDADDLPVSASASATTTAALHQCCAATSQHAPVSFNSFHSYVYNQCSIRRKSLTTITDVFINVNFFLSLTWSVGHDSAQGFCLSADKSIECQHYKAETTAAELCSRGEPLVFAVIFVLCEPDLGLELFLTFEKQCVMPCLFCLQCM